MFKFSHKIVEGLFDDTLEEPRVHVLILRHELHEDMPLGEGKGFMVSGQVVVETFTRNSLDMAREDAIRRVGELTVAAG